MFSTICLCIFFYMLYYYLKKLCYWILVFILTIFFMFHPRKP